MSVLEMGNRVWADEGETPREIAIKLRDKGHQTEIRTAPTGETMVSLVGPADMSVVAIYKDQEFDGEPLEAQIAVVVGGEAFAVGTHIGGTETLVERLSQLSFPEAARREMVAIASQDGFAALKSIVRRRA